MYCDKARLPAFARVDALSFFHSKKQRQPEASGCRYRSSFYMESMRISSELCCASVRQFHLSNILRCEGVRTTLSSPSAKNCESVMPKASHIFSNDANDGVMSFLYHEEIVDRREKPERSASWYSDQPRASRCVLIIPRIYLSFSHRQRFFVYYTVKNRCILIVIIVVFNSTIAINGEKKCASCETHSF